MAQKRSFIRDTEIENIIRGYATPLFQTAGLQPSAVNIYLINDDTLNAFVAGGQKLFINTGLLMRSTSSSQIIGVIAHETGHMAGGHLSKIPGAIEDATAHTILSYILGGAAAVGGRPDVGAAIIAGGQSIGQRSFLQFSRTQETAADQAAVRLLDGTQQSTIGLLKFMEVLEGQELLTSNLQDPYVRTHPLSADRIQFLRNHVANSAYTNVPANPEFEAQHARMKAKLIAFTRPFNQTMRAYPETDKSVAARYARAVALYRKPDTKAALDVIDGLVRDYPDDGYFHELKGQILFEAGRSKESIPAYQRAIELLPGSPLILTDLARAQIAAEDPALLQPAIENLRHSVGLENDRPFAWRQLAIAYGRSNLMGETSHALAQEALLQGRYVDAIGQGERALKLLKPGSPDYLRSQDIIALAQNRQKKEAAQRR